MRRRTLARARLLIPVWKGVIAKTQLPRQLRRSVHPVRLGSLRRTTPVSDRWGFDRGTPIDRYYIERFLECHRADIRGHALELRDSSYVDRFGVGVLRCDVLDIDPANPRATVIADLTTADGIADATYDCVVLTQTLQFIFDYAAAVRHVHRILKPGGTLLVTVPCVSRLAPRYGLDHDYWRFTPASCARLFGSVFGSERVTVTSSGNVLSGIAFLTGLASQELTIEELDVHDAYFPLIVTVRAVKAGKAEVR